MPGTAAWAVPPISNATATITTAVSVAAFRVFSFTSLIAALSCLVHNHNFGHQTAEVLGVVRQVIKIRGVEEVRAWGNARSIKNRIQRLTAAQRDGVGLDEEDRKSTRLNSSHLVISYAVFCLKKK